MSLKENIKSIKQEIGVEEQFLESVIKSERFYKKYKKYIISGAVVCVIVAIGYTAFNIVNDRNLKISNEVYEKLIQTPNDKEALSVLKDKNPALYSVLMFQEAIKNNNIAKLELIANEKNNKFLSDLSNYQLEQLKNSKVVKSKLLNGFALLEEGYDFLKQGKKEQADLKFAQIDPNSPLSQIVKNLNHYQGKTK